MYINSQNIFLFLLKFNVTSKIKLNNQQMYSIKLSEITDGINTRGMLPPPEAEYDSHEDLLSAAQS